MLSLVERVKSGHYSDNEKVFFNTVPDKIASTIEKITGIDVKGFRVAIEARQIYHILNDHGPKGTSDHSMADPNDIARIGYTLDDPDDIRESGTTKAYTHFKNGKNRLAPTVRYEKSIGDKSYYVVQAVPDTKAKILYVVSAFIEKSGYKKEAQQLINANGPDATAKTDSAETSNYSIRNHDSVVNKRFSDRDPIDFVVCHCNSSLIFSAVCCTIEWNRWRLPAPSCFVLFVSGLFAREPLTFFYFVM